MHKSDQRGFGPVGILLVILVLIGVVGVGYYVKDNSKPTKIFPAPAAKTLEKSVLGEEEKNWLQYTAPGYKIRLADGWVISNKQNDKAAFSTTKNEDLSYKKGVKAIVNDYVPTGPGEFDYGFYLDYSKLTNSDSCNTVDGISRPIYQTVGGHDVYVSVSKPIKDDGALLAGDKSYFWCVDISTVGKVSIGYIISSSMQDYSEIVDRVVRTIE